MMVAEYLTGAGNLSMELVAGGHRSPIETCPVCTRTRAAAEAKTEREFLGEPGPKPVFSNFKREWPPRYERVVGTFKNADDDLSALLALQIEGVPLHRYKWSPLSDDTQYVIERIDNDGS